jgi:hypothetical protein
MKLKLTCGHSAVLALLVVSGWNAADAGDGTRKGQARAAVQEQKSFDGFVAGIHDLPEGSSPYGVFLQSNTTTDMTPEQVRALGLQQVA